MQVFQNLTKGIRFSKDRFQEEFKLFNENSPSDRPSTPLEDAPRPHLKRRRNNIVHPSDNEQKQHSEDLTQNIPSTWSHLETTDDVRAFRRMNDIRVDGPHVPAPATSFFQIFQTHAFPHSLPETLRNNGYLVPTPVQLQAMPILLHHRDVLACAPTGCGKTLAYLLPLLHVLHAQKKNRVPGKTGIHALVLAPTKDLAHQIERELKKLVSKKCKCVVFQNEAQCNKQTHCDVLISTPHCLAVAVQNERVNLEHLQLVVLDECDKLLEKPGQEQVQQILKACPEDKLIGMFSATLPGDMELFAKSILKPDSIRVIVGHKNTVTTNIQQTLTFVRDEQGKRSTLRQQLHAGALRPPVLVFVQTAGRARTLHDTLASAALPVAYVHGERTPAQRAAALDAFRTGHNCILVATDVLARGMDLPVNTVVNFDFPTSTESYIHRIGRTGRAGRAGHAVTYFTLDDAKYLRSIVNIMKESGCDVPDWMLKLNAPSQKQKQQLKVAPPKRRKFIVTPKTSAPQDVRDANTGAA